MAASIANRPIVGAGGGGKGGGQSGGFTEEPNTLRSRSVARSIDVISEGEIGGLVAGAQSIYFDGTRLQNPDGSYNFPNVSYAERRGTPDQDYVAGYEQVETERPIGVQVVAATPVVRTISDPTCTAARVTVRIPALSALDTETGNLGPTSLEFRIEVEPDGGSYQRVSQSRGWVDFSGLTSPDDVTALEIVVSTNTPAEERDETVTLTVQYREVGSGTWLTLGSESIDVKNDTRWRDDEPSPYIYSTEVSRTYTITDLPEAQYELNVVAGTLRSARAQAPVDTLVSGKTVSPYEVSYYFALPGDGPWNVKVTRVTPDSASVNLSNDLFWSSMTEIIDVKLTYPDSALIALSVDAESFGGKIPIRSYDVTGIKIQVPSNYDPETREYTGIWDGTFELAVSDNPAWVLYDLLVNDRYGLGQVIDVAQVDKWTLYQIGQYCDEFVDDGFGGQEPRFTFNAEIRTREEAYKAVQAFASSFRGMTYWASGAVTAVQDAPADPVKLVSQANVINGTFNYQGAGLKSIYTVALVWWNDPAEAYRSKPELYEDKALIERYGWRQTEITAFGCTSRGQAHRFGKWLVDSNVTEGQIVAYTAGFDHADVRPGDIIAIADPFYAGLRMGGRVVAGGTSFVEIDSGVDIEADQTYTVSVTLPDGTIADRDLTNAPGSGVTTLTWTAPVDEAPLIESNWVLTASNLEPRRFRVISNVEVERNKFEISALFHDPTKYARVEQGIELRQPEYSVLPTGQISPPASLTVREYLFTAGPSPRSAITVSWSPSSDSRARFYELEVKGPSDADYRPERISRSVSLDIYDIDDGLYSFRVRALDSLGVPSAWLTRENVLVAGLQAPPGDVIDYRIVVSGNIATHFWTGPSDLDLSHYRIKFTPLTTGATWGAATDYLPQVTGTSVQAAAATGTFLIKAVDTTGHESVNATLVILNISGLDGFNAVLTQDEDPTFSGTKTNCEVETGGTLILTDSEDLTNIAVLDDVPASYVDADAVVGIGYYDFDGPFDLGEIYTSRVSVTMEASGTNFANVMASWPTLASVASLSGADPEQWGIVLLERHSDDAPSGSPTWSDWKPFVIGDYAARTFEFRAVLYTLSADVTPAVEALSVTIDMPDRVAGDEDLACGTGGLTVTYDPAFKASPAVGIVAQGLATGDYYEVTSKDRFGFTIIFKDSGGSPVARTFDYVARGYGYER